MHLYPTVSTISTIHPTQNLPQHQLTLINAPSSINPHKHLRLSASAPHPLEVPILLRQPVHTVVTLAHRAHESTQSVDLVVAGVAAVLAYFADGDLDGGMVGSFDNAVGGGTLAGDVTVRAEGSVCAK